MRRFVINSLLMMLALFTTMPVFAAEANYDSNGVTAFYGKYEYPKEEPEKEKPAEKTEADNEAANETVQPAAPAASSKLASTLPVYKGEGAILPVTGDTSSGLTSLLGVALLALLFFKLKEVENTEKNTIC